MSICYLNISLIMLLEFWLPSKTQHKTYPLRPLNFGSPHKRQREDNDLNTCKRILLTRQHSGSSSKPVPQGSFQVRRASFLLEDPKTTRFRPAELSTAENLLHLTDCRPSASKLLRTRSYSTSTTYLNYRKFSTFLHCVAV